MRWYGLVEERVPKKVFEGKHPRGRCIQNGNNGLAKMPHRREKEHGKS
jgi:hypothetical protein